MNGPCNLPKARYDTICGKTWICDECKLRMFPITHITDDDKMRVDWKLLIRITGTVLAKAAAKKRRMRRTKGWDMEGHKLKLMAIRSAITAHCLGSDMAKGWHDLKEVLSDVVLRKALKHWKDEGKVKSHRGGRNGTEYRWILTAETKEWDRRASKRKLREEERKIEDEAKAVETALTQKVADELSEYLELDAGTLKSWGTKITITSKQAVAICRMLKDSSATGWVNGPTLQMEAK